MDIAVAQQFLREHENAILATWRRDGRLQMSLVTVGLDGAGRAIISQVTKRPIRCAVIPARSPRRVVRLRRGVSRPVGPD